MGLLGFVGFMIGNKNPKTCVFLKISRFPGLLMVEAELDMTH